jgi:hypothetical protein
VYLMLKNKKFYFKINNEDYKLAFDLKKRWILDLFGKIKF